ncbi:MAG TPA: metalloregulator ArsR/SmtB family transcription factor [Roseiflexaceae bacterium]|nr:metalloregulator ArsR/SmtB family transcription factor [Roseiflexaceae bacterium]HMP38750.1 metalloregulator ArsR/SmtB family transcription factor [Roseiflexaceae bacterium]
MNQILRDEMLTIVKAMAHENRLRILGILADGEWSVRELAELLDLTEPTISHHLAKLYEADLITMRTAGTSHLYRLNGTTLQRVNRELFSPQQVADMANDVSLAGWEQKVLRAFLDGEQITRIPDQRKKREVILKWLAEKIERDVRYSELELNALIKHYHPDTATLRRELVASRLMQRDNGIYWRI